MASKKMTGPGRPQVLPKDKKVRLTTRLHPKTLKALTKAAKKETKALGVEFTPSELVRRIVEDYLGVPA